MSTRPPQRSAPAVASMLVVFAGLAYGGWFWLKADSRLATDTFETATQTGMLSPIQESITIDVPSLDTPAIVDLATSKSADSEATSAYFVSKSTTVGTLMPSENKGTSTERLASKLASTDTTRFEPSVAQIPESGAEITDLTVADTKMLALPKTGTPSPVLLDELARTQILTSPNSDIGDMHNSNIAIANLRDPEKEITIRAVAASWVEIVRDNGEEVMAKLMQAGDSYVVEGNTRLYLSTGNAGGLMVVVGADEPLSMGAIGEIVRDLPLMKDRLSKAL